MQFGVVFPTTEIGVDPGAIRDFAVGVEALGFDHLIAYDHVLGAPHDGRQRPLSGPYDQTDLFHEVFVLFGHLAAVTERIGLVVGVLVQPGGVAAVEGGARVDPSLDGGLHAPSRERA